MNGLSIFQIKVSNKYTGDDFDEDLRTVLRRAGTKGEKICFIMDESNVLESGFLERMNTLLANAEVPGLFEGDEHAALMTACKEGSQRDGLMLDSHEELYRWFTQQVAKNLHVVFTMNPPENGLASRAATSPALFNRCVLDWFGDTCHHTLRLLSSLSPIANFPCHPSIAPLSSMPWSTFICHYIKSISVSVADKAATTTSRPAITWTCTSLFDPPFLLC